MGIKVEGLDEIRRNINKLQKRAKEIDGKNQVPLPELMPNSFIQKYTGFNSLQEMFDMSGLSFESEDEFEAVSEELNDFIAKNSQFKDWQEMINKAGALWIGKKLGF